MKTKNLFFLVACLIFVLNVKAQDNYLRVTDLSQIQNGSTVILAARHDSLSSMSYYAMSNEAAGKPQGVSFEAAMSDESVMIPSDVTDNENEYCWTVGITGGDYTFINPEGDMIGYGSSGTDFVKNGTNSTWSITAATSGKGTIVPNHNAFIITNVGVANRSVAFRKYSNDAVYEKFAPYSNSASNIDGDVYFFYIDIFVKSSELTPVVSLPKFSPAGGDYITTQNVTITCETEDAKIYYTIDGKTPTDTSLIYSSPIEISKSTTIKAFAKKEGMQNSGIVTVKYNIIEPVTVSFYDNGNIVETRTLAKGYAIGELPQQNTPNGFMFNGWTDKDISGSVDVTPKMMTSASVVDEDINLYAVYSVSGDNCTETEVSSLKQSDVAVIAVCRDGKYYAMSQIKGDSGQPMAMEINVSNGKITSAVSDDMKWNVAYDKGNMKIYPNADEENWLYCTSGSGNNSVRIGDNTDNNIFEMKTIEIDDVVYPDYLYNVATSRFVGVYYDDESYDWRAYKLTTSGAFPTNIKNQSYHFFKSEGGSIYCTNIDVPQSQTIVVDTTWENVSVVNKIIVEKDVVLTIKGAIACTNPENLIIKDGAQLIHNNNGVNAVIEKEIEGYGSTNEGWYTISSPLVGNTYIYDVEGLMTNEYDMYRYDEPTSLWYNAKETSNNFEDMQAGRGYLYANKYDVTLSFTGELNNNSVDYFLTKTDGNTLSGFHLIGNPFAHNIYKGKNAAIDNDNLVKGYYVLSDSGIWGAKISDDTPIVPCQSILVKTTKEGNISINKTNALPSNNETEDVITISVSDDYYEDVTHVIFNDEDGLEKINHRNIDVPMIYIPMNEVNYAVAAINNDATEIPLFFKAKLMGEYTIRINKESVDLEHVYLVDNFTGEVTNMLLEEYSFMATSNDNPERFVIKLYDINSVDENQDSRNFVYVNDSELIVNNIKGSAVVCVYDVVGRIIANLESYHETSKIISTDSFKPGIYIVKVIDDNGVKIQKIFIE